MAVHQSWNFLHPKEIQCAKMLLLSQDVAMIFYREKQTRLVREYLKPYRFYC